MTASDRELLGAPFVPPPGLTRALNRFRRGLRALHHRSAPPSLRIFESMLALADNRVLALLVELDLPDALDHPATAGELASRTHTRAEALERVLRYAAARGFLRADRRGRFRANAFTRFLRRNHPGGWRGWIDFAGSEWWWASWRRLDAPLGDGRSGTEAATGHPFFEYTSRVDPAAGEAFDRAMAAGGALQAIALDHAVDFASVGSICDVGGGTGALVERLLSRHRHLTAILFDLPEVVGHARPGLAPGGMLSNRCTVAGGDFFEAVPGGADRYLLLAIVHDWGDDEARRILANVAAAMGPRGRALVVENVLAERPTDDFATMSDLLMLTLTDGGRERTRSQFEELFAGAGLTCQQTIPLATGAVAFELAVSPRPATRGRAS